MSKFIFIIGLGRCGTSYMTQCLHDAGVPMWIDDPHRPHLEDKKLVWSVDFLRDLQITDGLRMWRKRAEERGVFPCGGKEPRLVRYPLLVRDVFPDALFIVCHRPIEKAARSWSNLTGMPYDLCRQRYVRDACLLRFWPKAFVFDYYGDVRKQQQALSEQIGRHVDLLTNWRASTT